MTRLRILHLGLGAFHRAHQAVYRQGLIDAIRTPVPCTPDLT